MGEAEEEDGEEGSRVKASLRLFFTLAGILYQPERKNLARRRAAN